jgi:hypothetical protein
MKTIGLSKADYELVSEAEPLDSHVTTYSILQKQLQFEKPLYSKESLANPFQHLRGHAVGSAVARVLLAVLQQDEESLVEVQASGSCLHIIFNSTAAPAELSRLLATTYRYLSYVRLKAMRHGIGFTGAVVYKNMTDTAEEEFLRTKIAVVLLPYDDTYIPEDQEKIVRKIQQAALSIHHKDEKLDPLLANFNYATSGLWVGPILARAKHLIKDDDIRHNYQKYWVAQLRLERVGSEYAGEAGYSAYDCHSSVTRLVIDRISEATSAGNLKGYVESSLIKDLHEGAEAKTDEDAGALALMFIHLLPDILKKIKRIIPYEHTAILETGL